MKKLITAISLLFLPILFLSGQNIDYEFFIKKADKHSLLFEGEIAKVYRFNYTGHYYAFSPEYELGDVVYNSKKYFGVYLNLNSHLDVVNVKYSSESRPVALARDLVETFTMGDKLFVRLDAAPGLPSAGFYQVVYRGENGVLYKRITQELEEKLEGNNLLYYFDRSEKYYLLNNGVYTRIKKKKEIAKYLNIK